MGKWKSIVQSRGQESAAGEAVRVQKKTSFRKHTGEPLSGSTDLHHTDTFTQKMKEKKKQNQKPNRGDEALNPKKLGWKVWWFLDQGTGKAGQGREGVGAGWH